MTKIIIVFLLLAVIYYFQNYLILDFPIIGLIKLNYVINKLLSIQDKFDRLNICSEHKINQIKYIKKYYLVAWYRLASLSLIVMIGKDHHANSLQLLLQLISLP